MQSPAVKITQDVFDQVAMYNMTLNVPYLVVTNGLEHFVCHIDRINGNYKFLQDIPMFQDINH